MKPAENGCYENHSRLLHLFCPDHRRTAPAGFRTHFQDRRMAGRPAGARRGTGARSPILVAARRVPRSAHGTKMDKDSLRIPALPAAVFPNLGGALSPVGRLYVPPIGQRQVDHLPERDAAILRHGPPAVLSLDLAPHRTLDHASHRLRSCRRYSRTFVSDGYNEPALAPARK